MRWEYLWIEKWSAFPLDRQKKLNELGAEGWELVSLVWTPACNWDAVFKRPVNK